MLPTCSFPVPFDSSFIFPSLDTRQFVPRTVDSASSTANCLWAAICTVLTGWNKHARVLEELLVSHRRGGPYFHLYRLPLADPLWQHPEQLEFACTSDFLVLARVMTVNILVYWPAHGDMPARWVQFAGHHHRPAGATIYLAHTVLRNQGHVVSVRGLRPV